MTATWRTREELLQQLVTLARQGLSRRALARALGVSRNTVRVMLAAHKKARDAEPEAKAKPPARAPRASKTDAYQARIKDLLARYPDITAQRVLETLREQGFVGGYTAVKKCIRRLRPPPRPEPSLATPEYGPGEMSESDWSPYEVRYTDGRKDKVQAFSYVLIYSRRKYLDLYRHADLFGLMDGHVQAFTRFDGCAHACTYDGQKCVVLRWEGQQPIYNPRFLAFAAHYEFRPRAVRGDPNAKPRVERSFWELVRSFFNGRSFVDFEHHRAQKRTGSTPSPISVADTDRPRLIASPRSASTSCLCRATPTTPRGSSTASVPSTASSPTMATPMPSPTSTSPTSSLSASPSMSSSSTPPT